jgi:TonB family protein
MSRVGAQGSKQSMQPGWPFLLRTMALVMMAMLTLPGRAADERAVKSKVPPVYPEIAKRMKVSGVVKIEATVDAEGKVTAVKTVSGNHVLSEAAEEAVRKWKFVSGPSESVVPVDINFSASSQ